MENLQVQEETTKLIQWNKHEVRILPINQETSFIDNGSTPLLVEQE